MSSKVYSVLQGVRQGRVLSMSLYQVYIADLLTRLKSSGCGTYHDGHYYGSPCFADDLVLIALFTKTLCKTLDIAADYANMWRYSFNVKKSAILAYTKSKVNLDKIADISCVDEVTHVGIPLCIRGDMTSDAAVTRMSKGRRAFMAMCGLGSDLKLPLVAVYIKLYWSLCVAGMLYGCEVMVMGEKVLEMFEKAHRHVARRIKILPVQCSNVLCLAGLGWWTIQSYIDKRKLMYLRKLLDPNSPWIYRSVVIR